MRRLVLGVCLVSLLVCCPCFADDDQALLDGGARLEDLQNDDGGWDWPLDNGDPSTSSPANTIGPIGMGLAQAHWSEGGMYNDALLGAGQFLLAKTNNFSPPDGYLAVMLDSIFGGSTYRDHVYDNFYGPLALGTYDKNGEGTLYDTASYVDGIRTKRANDGIPNLAAWDIGMGLVGAASCGASVSDWVDGTKAEIDELDSNEYYDVIGLAGAVFGLAYVSEDFDPTAGEHAAASSLVDLADILAGYQIATGTGAGGFTWNAGYMTPSDSNETVQETAYAILALNEVDRLGYLDTITDAADWLIAFQLVNGGWKNWEGGGENNEVTGEAMWGIHWTYLDDIWVDDSGSNNVFGYGDLPLASIQLAVDLIEGLEGTVHVGEGDYTEAVTIEPGSGEISIAGAGRDTTRWEGQIVLDATDTGSRHTGSPTTINLSGFTFDSGSGYAVKICKYEAASLYLDVSDNRFVGYGGLWVCRNSYASRDPVTGEAAVQIHDNIFETGKGLCMSNAQGYDIYSNFFDLAGSYAAYVGSGCYSSASLTRGDHRFYSNTIQGATNHWGSIDISFYDHAAGVVNLPNTIALNCFIDNENALVYWIEEPTVTTIGDEVHYNSFEGNTNAVVVGGPYADGILVDATLNWWGDASGPSGEGTGMGDGVSEHVIFSPWLGIDPDGDPSTVGVQLVSPVVFVVDDVGPKPDDGYLGTAILAANDLTGVDTIQVQHGVYDSSEAIEDGVEIVSEVGSAAHTTLTGAVEIMAEDVLLGKLRQGFTINGPITVGAGVDATTVHINWNDLYGIVTNSGDGLLDATFNYWGEGSGTSGLVDIHPVLPETSDTIIGYMDKYHLSAIGAIDYSKLSDYMNGKSALAALRLMRVFGFSIQEAVEIIRQYGRLRINIAIDCCHGDYDAFLRCLLGYGTGGGGGGGLLGGGAGGAIGDSGLPVFVVGDVIPLELQVFHPVSGEPVDDATVDFSIVRTMEDGSPEICAFGVMSYDSDLAAYTFEFDTSGLEPGVYDVYIGVAGGGESQHMQIEIVAP